MQILSSTRNRARDKCEVKHRRGKIQNEKISTRFSIGTNILSFLDMYLLASENDQIIFTPVENEYDLEATVHIGRQHFGDFTYSLETRLQWFRISPKGDAVLKHDGVVVGYFSMQAIKKEAVERIFEHKGGEVQTEDMIPIQVGKTMGERLECYISAIAVTTASVKKAQSRTYGMLLLMGIAERFVELGKEGIAKRFWMAKWRSAAPSIKKMSCPARASSPLFNKNANMMIIICLRLAAFKT